MIKFGTSGFRGVIGEDFIKENVQKIAQALSEMIKENREEYGTVAIGYDNRFLGDFAAKWFTEVLAGNKIQVKFFSSATISPVIGFEAKKAIYGVMITASHNPPYYNGIKVFVNGGKESDDVFGKRISELSNNMAVKNIKTLDFETAISEKLITLTEDISAFIGSVLSFTDTKSILEHNPKVLIDSMFGKGGKVIEQIFKTIGFKNYHIIHGERDVLFNGLVPAPYVHNLKKQAEMVKKDYDFGFAYDADGDRFACIDSGGEIYDCNFLLAILYQYLYESKKMTGDVVKNVCHSNLSAVYAKSIGQICHDCKVGFKNIAIELETTSAYLGGESNGLAFSPHGMSKDGIMCTMNFLSMLSSSKKTLTELIENLQKKLKFPSHCMEFAYPVTSEKKEKIHNAIFKQKICPKLTSLSANSLKIISANYEDGFKMNFENGYWAMVRFSGTENVIRIYTEMKSAKECEFVVSQLEDFIGTNVRQI